MRKCYEKHFEALLIEAMKQACDRFVYMDADALRRSGRLAFYGPGKLVGFEWNPCKGLKFVVTFRVPKGKDDFEASCEWTESGKVVKNQPLLDSDLFSDRVLQLPNARALIQSLSICIGDPPDKRAIRWPFWQPSADITDTDAWFKEFMEDELRELSDEEAHRRVKSAVTAATADVLRCGFPWFQRKLAMYLSGHKTNQSSL